MTATPTPTLPETHITRWLSNFNPGIESSVGPIVGLTRKGWCALKHWIWLCGTSLVAKWEWLQNLAIDWDGTLSNGVPDITSVKTMNGFQTVFVAGWLVNSDYHGHQLVPPRMNDCLTKAWTQSRRVFFLLNRTNWSHLSLFEFSLLPR